LPFVTFSEEEKKRKLISFVEMESQSSVFTKTRFGVTAKREKYIINLLQELFLLKILRKININNNT
jgi:hypothetical protein